MGALHPIASRLRIAYMVSDSSAFFAPFSPSRDAALRTAGTFMPRAGRAYTDSRNYDYGPARRDNVSCLSPYLRRRIISEPELLRMVLQNHDARAAEKFIQEICWRTYWKGWLEHRPTVWQDFLTASGASHLQTERHSQLQAAQTGQTGIECFDSWVQELLETGYLHNHARMWFASIWVFTLGLAWEHGAAFFWRHLLDGDPASNTLGWRWVAGLQTPGKTYAASASNIARFTEGRFTPAEIFPADPGPAEGTPNPPASPPDILDDLHFGLPSLGDEMALLVTPEDLTPDQTVKNMPPHIISLSSDFAPAGRDASVLAFENAALEDMEKRLHHAGHHIHRLTAKNGTEQFTDCLAQYSLQGVHLAYQPVGPWRDSLSPVLAAVRAAGFATQTTLRHWDHQAWPHATKGFFPFKKHIPDLLANMTYG